MANPTVYGSWHSTCTQAVFTVVAEKAGKVDLVNIDMMKGEHKQPAHMARQPFGKIPALKDGSVEIYESRAIGKYFNSKFKTGNALIPSTIEGQAVHDQWLSLEQGTANPQLSAVLLQRVWGPAFYGLKTDQAKVDAAVEQLKTFFDVLEKQVKGKKYILGDQYTLVDVFLTPYINLFMTTPEASLVKERPGVAAYVKNLLERPSWTQVIANTK